MPPANLVAEEPRQAQLREANRGLGNDSMVPWSIPPNGRHLDDEAITVEAHLQGRVVDVAPFTWLKAGHNRLEQATTSTNETRGFTRTQGGQCRSTLEASSGSRCAVMTQSLSWR